MKSFAVETAADAAEPSWRTEVNDSSLRDYFFRFSAFPLSHFRAPSHDKLHRAAVRSRAASLSSNGIERYSNHFRFPGPDVDSSPRTRAESPA